MKKLTDEELDSLFQKAADGLSPSYDPNAWVGMSAKLSSSSTSIFKRWFPLTISGLLIFSGGVWVGSQLTRNVKSESQPIEISAIRHDANQKGNNTSQPNLSEKSLVSKAEKETANQSIDRESNRPNNIVPSKLENADGESIKININDTKPENKIDSPTPNAFPDEREIALISEADNSKDLILVEDVETSNRQDSTAALKNEAEDEALLLKRSIFIRGLASPDFSSIGFGPTASAGSNYALLVEYQFSKRWSVSSGAIRSFKKYSSKEEVVYSGYTADELHGACRILDIPLNVYYQIKPGSRTSFFIGAGLSSYIMLTENYTYTVNTYYGNRYYSSGVERENNEWFKILNLSLGVQYQLGSKFFLQAEPFIKAPLAGVGEGDVKLSSLGVFFGLKYKLN